MDINIIDCVEISDKLNNLVRESSIWATDIRDLIQPIFDKRDKEIREQAIRECAEVAFNNYNQVTQREILDLIK